MPLTRRINQDDLRNHNLSVVLSTLARSVAPLSRAALAKETGLTKATLSLLSDMLLANHVIHQLSPAPVSTAHGRPSTPLAFDTGHWAGIGVQINTDGFGYIVLDVSGTVVDEAWRTQAMDDVRPDDIFDRLDAMLRPVEARLAADGCAIVGTGLALPGLVAGDGVLLTARNLGWRNLDLRRFAVVDRLDAIATNEATLAAIAQIPGYATPRAHGEWPIDAFDSFLYVSTDIGIGGAYARAGQVVGGDRGFAGEIGHCSVDRHGVMCGCGRRGCLEMYAGRRAMMIAAGLAKGSDAAQPELVPRLIEAWHAGDASATAAVDDAVDALACAIASVINVIDVDTVMLGGLWSGFGEPLRADLERRVQSQIMARDVEQVRLLFPPIVDHPALYGAAVTGLRRLFDDPLSYLTIG
ncbi:NagC family transcriptional regulator [Bifidobacterium ramosum]|uniref:NagC family transcriptional regulator n=1 Tax=Bifidobacterium ramosum TaxID=1798158 RepID=A0A6L4WXT5_9BIFI|nr:ROK family protein [Bifidobacterium ramosum]KAB8286977.1 NagC family transcriptional regulator [Bifidobacterium ramosum]NEG72515.1 ROK family protein [Bifidobacterium ramosum]